MTQLLEKTETAPVAKPPAVRKGRIGIMVVAGALIGLLGGWGAFEVAAEGADARRLTASIARSQAMDEFYRAQAEQNRLQGLIARSQSLDLFYGAVDDAERLERTVARSQAMDEFYRNQADAKRLAGLIARSQAINDFYGIGD